jgi:transposase InsO family protein
MRYGPESHGSATTTEAGRRAIQPSQASPRALAQRDGINQKTVAKWKRRSTVSDQKTGPKEPGSTVLSIEDEAIVVLMRREGFAMSASKVGRILARLVARGAIVPAPVLRRRPEGRRIRFTARQRYARRLPKGRKARSPGEIVQIDALFVNVRPGCAIKRFTAYDPAAKWTIGRVARSALAANATALLEKPIVEAPFPVRGIQVDGGSQFLAAFERACRDKGLELCILPPKRPDLNGCVERPIHLALRVLRRLRPPPPHRKTASLRRRLRPPVQPPRTPSGPWRQSPRRGHSASDTQTRLVCLNPDKGFRGRPKRLWCRATFALAAPLRGAPMQDRRT